jgi:hypothetical protein
MKTRCFLIPSSLDWQMTSKPVLYPAIPVLAERVGKWIPVSLERDMANFANVFG